MTPAESGLAARYQALLDVIDKIAAHRRIEPLFHDLRLRLQSLIRFEAIMLALYDEARGVMRLRLVDTAFDHPIQPPVILPVEQTPAAVVFQTRAPLYVPDIRLETRFHPFILNTIRNLGGRSICWLPLATSRRTVGVLGFGTRVENAYAPDEIDFMAVVARQVAVAVENALAFEEIEELKRRLAEEKVYLEEEIRSEYQFPDMVGSSPALAEVQRAVETVAPTDSTVLILGDTGTGKELVARSIHRLSARAGRTFVKLNCAAIPTGLVESELFGHERGAFTGAIAQKVGRFELADKGTLFLDEIGDIPPELQPKLLRVLQEGEFERLGGTRTLRADVRLIAATNRDLPRLVKEERFRADLFYRLNVFPIAVPALRDRRQDIPTLVRYFVQEIGRRIGKRIVTIPAAAMEALARHTWPGNIRELQNFIERSVILSRGETLNVPLAELERVIADGPPESSAPAHAPRAASAMTRDEAERRHILGVLESANWRLAGPHGAASRLGMKRSTLQSRMKRLGIARPQ